MENRGRFPESFELSEATAIRDRFGTFSRALAIVRRVADDETWQRAREIATDDLAVYLALASFGGRPKFTGLPADIQLDVRSLFGSYKNACAVADELLFRAGNQAAIDHACRDSRLGKLTREALYVHVTALGRLSPLLRIYEGCGRALAGTVDSATVVKLNRVEPKISYLVYPRFDEDAHPALSTSVRADLRRLRLRVRDFTSWDDPPVLHRKETFVDSGYPGREKFAQLTAREERLGLLSEPTVIGTRTRWGAVVARAGFRISGHRLVRCRAEPGET